MRPKPTALVADDELTIRHVLTRLLEREGLDVTSAEDGEQALALFETVRPDIVLLDLMMPKLNGFEVCERIKSDPDNRLVPVIIVTASSANANRVRGVEAGADDFLSKPVDPIELSTRVRSMLRIKRYADELERAETVLFALARSIEGKDPYTEGHCERLAIYGEMLGQRLGLDEELVVALRRGGVLHDIGKVAVPDSILLKPGPLTPEQREIMEQHTVIGERICRGLKSLHLVLPIIRHHHEKRNGTGYPDGLAGDEIPLVARVLQVVDVYDALMTERPYKKAYTSMEALQIMQEEVDKGWWDPEIFQEFCVLVHEGTAARRLESALQAAAESARAAEMTQAGDRG